MAYTVLPDFSVHPLPRVIRVEPSSACNLRCVHCPTGIRKGAKRGVMSRAVFNKVVKEIRDNKGVDVVVLYHGGEPFLNKDIFHMIKAIKKLGIRFVKTVTNGMMVTEEMIPRILKSGIDSIEFSLDGNSPEDNDRLRRGGDYKRVASIVKLMLMQRDKFKLVKPDIYVANTQVTTKKNFKSNKDISTPRFLLDDFRDFNGKVLFKNTFMYKWPGFDNPEQYELLCPKREEKTPGYCNHVHEVTTIRWNGDVVPCCLDIVSQYIVGNIMQHSLSEIWNSEKYRSLRKSIYDRKFYRLCSHCHEVMPQSYLVLKDDEAANLAKG